MKRALILQHMNHDHPGRFLDWFAEDGIVPVPVRMFEGQEIPSLKDFDFMFVLGGAQDTWQEAEYPYLKAEKQAIREWVWDRAKPYFGVCLGHQLLATGLGGDVARADEGEVGVFEVTLTPDGENSALMSGIPASQKVMQWHHAEVKRVPQSGRVLAQSARTGVQALAIDNHALSTQFHCEFSPQTVASWSSLPLYIESLEKLNGPGAYDRLLRESYPLMPAMRKTTHQMWNNFKKASGLVK
jgi:GMP synthase-like glutamine amidotransferase